MSDISRLPASPVSNTPQASGTQKATIPETITPDLQAPVSPELPKTNDFFEADTQGNWFDNFPQATPNACMGEPAYIEVKPKTSAKLEELEKERTTLQNLAEANPLHPANTKKLADIGKARESANEAISRLRPPEEGAWYENNFITRANASVGRAALGFANDTVLGLAQMVQENAHKMPLIPGANVYSTGVEAAQQLNEYRIQQENLRLGNTTQEEISAQGKQQLAAMWDGLGEPITKPWNRGDYLEAVARGGLEVGSLLVGVGEAIVATKGARAANATNKAAVATRAVETANVVNKGAEAANIARGVETANVVKQTAKGAEGAGALGKPGQVKPISPGEVGGAGAKASKYGDEVVDGTKRVDFTKKMDVDGAGGKTVESAGGAAKIKPSQPEGGIAHGKKAVPDPNDPAPLTRQNETADLFAAKGYDIKMLPETKGGNGYGVSPKSNPDFLIEGKAFDCYTPKRDTPIHSMSYNVKEKTLKQAKNIVVNLDDSPFSAQDVIKNLKEYPIVSLDNMFVAKNGNLIQVYPW